MLRYSFEKNCREPLTGYLKSIKKRKKKKKATILIAFLHLLMFMSSPF